MTSSGDLEIIMDVSLPVEGRDVILVDDIVDTGLTLHNYSEYLKSRNPNSLKIAALIDKTPEEKNLSNWTTAGLRWKMVSSSATVWTVVKSSETCRDFTYWKIEDL